MEHLFPRSNRLIFSAWSEQDNELADKIWGSEKVTKLICAKGYFTKNEISERLQKEISYNKAYGVQYWKVCEKDTGAFIGCCGLHPYEKEPIIYELGFHLHENFWARDMAWKWQRQSFNLVQNTCSVTSILRVIILTMATQKPCLKN